MSSATIHPKSPSASQSSTVANPLPPTIRTPGGLALLELQGTINLPSLGQDPSECSPAVPIGRLDFPDYREDALDPSSTAWMKRVYLYVGQHQRLTGEVKKLPKPLAVVRRRRGDDAAGGEGDLEVVEIVKYKLMFSQRPEPVGKQEE